MGTNDGMLHAFYTKDKKTYTGTDKCVVGAVAGDYCAGEEAWAYIPTPVIPNLWKLADTSYATNHVNYVNGSVQIGDVCTANCTNSSSAVWKTILVGGFNAGGSGYYALDVTVPDAPVLLWEFTTTTGTGIIKDKDLGFSYGLPIITQKEDGTWVVVVTSGYNNVTTGTGKGYLYVLNAGTGVILSKITTGEGSTTTPSGLAKIAGWNNESAGNKVGYIYGGDLSGNLWRFDINSTASAITGCAECKGNGEAFLFSTLKGSDGFPQPVMTTPLLASIGGKRVVFVGTGKYLENSDLTNSNKQSFYAIKDADATTTLTNARTGLIPQTMANNPNGTATRLISSTNTVDFYVDRGWYIDFIDSGERVNIDSKLLFGTLVIPSLVPANTVCTPGGYGWINFLDYKTGKSIEDDLLISSKFDSPVVGVNEMYIDGKTIIGVVTAGGGVEKPQTVPVNQTPGGFQNRRSIWREIMP
jgi:type IV pilus assembly protein PilY1